MAGAVLVATRPESATSIAVLGFTAAILTSRSHHGLARAFSVLVRAGLPAAATLGAHAVANRLLTGEYSAAGSLTKVVWHKPHLGMGEQWGLYLGDLNHAVFRNLHHHFSTVSALGWIPVVLALVALLSPRTRTSAAILLASSASFLLVVAMNQHVIWQNERYTMPAVAWLLMAAGLGLGVLLFPPRSALPRLVSVPQFVCGLALAVAFGCAQVPRMREQITHFAQASKNIRDQQVTTGRLLRQRMTPTPRRILVNDAGAITYASDLPGLDIIGLGGYRDLPFARASAYGHAAVIELMERIPPEDRPDIFAIYPSWWGILPVWFGQELMSVTAEDNVGCGATDKVIYAADWKLLNTGDKPSSLRNNEVVVDTLDIADLVDERLHNYRFPKRGAGYVELRILADPTDARRDVLDGGRRIPDGGVEQFFLSSNVHAASMRLVVRTAPPYAGVVDVTKDGQAIGSFAFEPTDRWQELSLSLPEPMGPNERAEFAFKVRGTPRWVNYHVWLLADL